jgi:hypothetical protein
MIKITINEIDSEIFSATINMDMFDIEVEGIVWTDEVENLWGDQVSSISTIAYFHSITDMRVFTKGGYECSQITLDLAEFVKKELDKWIDDEVDNEPCSVDYSPRYYDLV